MQQKISRSRCFSRSYILLHAVRSAITAIAAELLQSNSYMLGSASAWALSYLAVKLFSKNSNLCDHGTWSSQTDGQTERRHAIS